VHFLRHSVVSILLSVSSCVQAVLYMITVCRARSSRFIGWGLFGVAISHAQYSPREFMCISWPVKGGMMTQLVECWTCGLEVDGSTASQAPLLSKRGQFIHTCVRLIPYCIIRYWQWHLAAEKVTMSLAVSNDGLIRVVSPEDNPYSSCRIIGCKVRMGHCPCRLFSPHFLSVFFHKFCKWPWRLLDGSDEM